MIENAVVEELMDVILQREWVIGAVNYDEDLHFSSYYLRASLRSATRDLYPGYTRLVSFYRNFNEYYYLLKEECIENSEAIIRKAEDNIGWLQSVLTQIRNRCERLQTVFDESMDRDFFRELSDSDLRKLYARHHHVHSELYTWARIPEALDRGVSYFSKYLLYLTREAAGSSSDCTDIYGKLTQPITPSILSESIDELTELVVILREDQVLRTIILEDPRRARMVLPNSLLNRFHEYHAKWKYLSYHGYGDRDLGDVATVIQRVADTLKQSLEDGHMEFIRDRLEANRVQRDKLLERLGFDPKHRQLFELYPQMGSVKLFRRYVQLRNFYYLDLMVEETARRLNCSEWQVRNLLPEEILASLDTGEIPHEAKSRCDGCIYYSLDGKSSVIAGEIVPRLLREMEKNTMQERDRKVLKGIVACRGRVTGTCKIVIRAHDTAIEGLRKGEVLVSHSTDPDLLNLLKVAGAVLTEQGGVTSHAALICRELRVPAIIGIRGLLDHVADGDTLEVDAEKGEVRIIQAADETPEAVISLGDASRKEVGGKARGLIRLVEMGFRVPDFVILQSEKVRQILGNSDSTEIKELKAWIRTRLAVKEAESFAVRSSSIDEDMKKTSAAGRFETLLDVSLDELPNSLKEFLRVNDRRSNGKKYCGSVVLQRMLIPEFSGVCITCDSRLMHSEILVVEAIPGSNVLLTKGQVVPTRFFVNRESGDIEIDKSANCDLDAVACNIRTVASVGLEIEKKFGGPVDVEWAFVNKNLYILQARRIIQ
jgi:phosphohistidine swiveling domain-containing protein